MLQFRTTLMVGALLRSLPGSSRRFGPPRRLASTLPSYVERHRHGALTIAYTEIYPGHQISRSPPLSLEHGIHPAFEKERERFSPSAGVAVIERGRVLTATGAVIAPEDELLWDVSDTALHEDPRTHPIFLTLKLPRVTPTDETVAVVTTYRSSDVYYHWLMDALPRLHLLQQSGLAYDKIVISTPSDYQRRSLELLGIDAARILAAPNLHIEAARLLVPSLPGVIGNPPAWACRFLRESFLPRVTPQSTPPRIFVSRARTGTRRVANEDEIVRLLESFGFERVFLEELPFLEQVRLFSQAEMVVSAHGSGLTNIVFCREGTPVIEMLSPNYASAIFWAMSEQVGLSYYYLLGQNKGGRTLPRGRVHEDIIVDAARLGRLVERLCTTTDLAGAKIAAH